MLSWRYLCNIWSHSLLQVVEQFGVELPRVLEEKEVIRDFLSSLQSGHACFGVQTVVQAMECLPFVRRIIVAEDIDIHVCTFKTQDNSSKIVMLADIWTVVVTKYLTTKETLVDTSLEIMSSQVHLKGCILS